MSSPVDAAYSRLIADYEILTEARGTQAMKAEALAQAEAEKDAADGAVIAGVASVRSGRAALIQAINDSFPDEPAAPQQPSDQPSGILVGFSVSDFRAASVKKRQPLRDFIRSQLIDRAVAAGADRRKAEQAAAILESERPFLDWLMNGGFEKLFALIMQLIGAFA